MERPTTEQVHGRTRRDLRAPTDEEIHGGAKARELRALKAEDIHGGAKARELRAVKAEDIHGPKADKLRELADVEPEGREIPPVLEPQRAEPARRMERRVDVDAEETEDKPDKKRGEPVKTDERHENAAWEVKRRLEAQGGALDAEALGRLSDAAIAFEDHPNLNAAAHVGIDVIDVLKSPHAKRAWDALGSLWRSLTAQK